MHVQEWWVQVLEEREKLLFTKHIKQKIDKHTVFSKIFQLSEEINEDDYVCTVCCKAYSESLQWPVPSFAKNEYIQNVRPMLINLI